MEAIRPIIDLLSPKVTIEAAPKSFSFSSRGKTVSFKTCLFLVEENNGYKIVAIGSGSQDYASAIQINIFDTDRPLPANLSRFDCLCQYLKFGLVEVTSPFNLFRPVIIFRGLKNFARVLNGFELGVIPYAGLAAGASRVDFEPGS